MVEQQEELEQFEDNLIQRYQVIKQREGQLTIKEQQIRQQQHLNTQQQQLKEAQNNNINSNFQI